MNEYEAIFFEDDIMQDVWKRKAEASEERRRFKGDMEGYHRYVETQMNALGFRYEPTGNGTNRLVKIEK